MVKTENIEENIFEPILSTAFFQYGLIYFKRENILFIINKKGAKPGFSKG